MTTWTPWAIGGAVALALFADSARADEGQPAAAPPAPAASPGRASGTTTAPGLGTTPGLEVGQHFSLDPVLDGLVTASGFGFSFLLGEVLSTGEIRPPVPAVSASSLLPIDRWAITQKIDPNAATYSNIGLYTALGFAVVDPILSGLRDGLDALIVDGFMYAESGSLALAVTDITKIGVRRPRPVDYINCAPTSSGTPSTNTACNSTDLGLSFFSGHAAGVAAVGATATYIAFVREPRTPRPWLTLGIAAALTTFVSYERVRAGAHFPTDVVAGSMAGATIGALVPHLHRHRQEAPLVWVGLAPIRDGASVSLGGHF
ncbi:MAG TPA: phosphatase PAP2 family protein [Gemmatimonadaceae bacterium]|nr:phosphatase PAP2 family protein [Gemmatimonadaceae bacterium]